jgi:predicted metal-binding transcription factor (methanogenesis marker protein 9)
LNLLEKNLKKIKLGDEEIMELIQQLKKTIIESAPRMKEEDFEHSWKKTINFEKMKIIEQKLFWNKIELDKIQGIILD